MFTVYPTKMKAMKNMHKSFKTEEEAKEYIASRNNPNNYTMEGKAKTVSKKGDKVTIDFDGAVQITRANVKNFYKKEGYILVRDPNGKALHVGKTKNMGKVFSNYVNCARYNQSYNFKLEQGDTLWFKECKTL